MTPLITRSLRCSLIFHNIMFKQINIINLRLPTVFLSTHCGLNITTRAPRKAI